MKRDMELVRKILLKVEADYIDEYIFNLKVEGYEMIEVAYHCDMLHQVGLVKYYKPLEADGGIYGFRVGPLSWTGHDYLEQIRNDEIWEKTMTTIEEKKLPKDLNTIASVAGSFIGGIISAMNS